VDSPDTLSYVGLKFQVNWNSGRQGLFGSGYGLFSLGFLGQFCMRVSSAHKGRSITVTFKNYLNTCNLNFGSFDDNYF
jgi:hypothetical protein